MILGGQLHRGQRRVLPDRLRGDLVGRDAGVGVHSLRGLRAHAAQPRGRAQRVHGRRVGGLMAEPGHDVHPIAKGFERLQDRRELEPAANGGGRPLVHDRAVGHVHEAQTRPARRGRLRQQRARRHHRVEERQREAHAEPLQERSPVEVFSCEKHDGLRSTALRLQSRADANVPSARGARFIWNGALFTMPTTMEEKRYS